MYLSNQLSTTEPLSKVLDIVRTIEEYRHLQRNHPSWLRDCAEEDTPPGRTWRLNLDHPDGILWARFYGPKQFAGKEFLVFLYPTAPHYGTSMDVLYGLFPEAMISLETLCTTDEDDAMCLFVFVDPSGPKDRPAPCTVLFPAGEDALIISMELFPSDEACKPIWEAFEQQLDHTA